MASYFLIQADPGWVRPLAQFLASMPGVYDVSVTSGPYDIIAEVTPEPERQQHIRSAARRAQGLTRLCVSQGSTRHPVMS